MFLPDDDARTTPLHRCLSELVSESTSEDVSAHIRAPAVPAKILGMANVCHKAYDALPYSQTPARLGPQLLAVIFALIEKVGLSENLKLDKGTDSIMR
jgi:hypothetical protein